MITLTVTTGINIITMITITTRTDHYNSLEDEEFKLSDDDIK